MKITVVDVEAQSAPLDVEADADITLGEFRAIAASLTLPSSDAALSGGTQHICHDGKHLRAVDDEKSLQELGVFDPPIVVVATATRGRFGDFFSRMTTSAAPPAAARPPVERATARPPVERAAAQPPVERAAPSVPPAASPTPPAAAPAGQPEDAVCRICFGAAHENGLGKLIAPCLCTGSMHYVHVACLNDWRTQSANPRSFYACDQCGYSYNVQRTKWAGYLESKQLHNAAACLLLVAATALSTLVCAPLGAARGFFRLVHFDPQNPWQVGQFVASRWNWWHEALSSGLLGVAIVGVGLTARDAYQRHRHMTHSWLIGVVTALATNDERIYRVFAMFGAVAASQYVLFAVRQVAKDMLSKWGSRILEVRR